MPFSAVIFVEYWSKSASYTHLTSPTTPHAQILGVAGLSKKKIPPLPPPPSPPLLFFLSFPPTPSSPPPCSFSPSPPPPTPSFFPRTARPVTGGAAKGRGRDYRRSRRKAAGCGRTGRRPAVTDSRWREMAPSSGWLPLSGQTWWCRSDRCPHVRLVRTVLLPTNGPTRPVLWSTARFPVSVSHTRDQPWSFRITGRHASPVVACSSRR
jgi:hypothetical protein